MPFCPTCGAEFVEGTTRCADCDVDLVDGPIETPGDFTELYTCESRMEAEHMKAILESKGVTCNLRTMESSSFPTGGGVMSPVRLVVDEKYADAATKVITEAIENGEIPGGGSFVEE